MSRVSSVSVSTTDPNYTRDSSQVTKTPANGASNDSVTVSAWEDGTSGTNAVVVLQVNAGATPTASTDANGNISIQASGRGTNYYLSATLNSSDPNNWTVQVGTSGGSNYQFKKGSGGGGH